jgi:hypothetical protein
MDRLESVERYSYFGSFRSDISNVGVNAAMLTEKGELTDIGAWYVGQPAVGNVPDPKKTLSSGSGSGVGRVNVQKWLVAGVVGLAGMWVL